MRSLWRDKRFVGAVVAIVFLGIIGGILVWAAQPTGADKSEVFTYQVSNINSEDDGVRLWANETESVVVSAERFEESGVSVGDTVRVCIWREGTWFNKYNVYTTEVRKIR